MILDNLHTLFETNGGFEEIRALILEFAVRGKLASQCPADPSADEVLQSIQAQNRKKRKKRKSQAAVSSPLFSLPSGWCWTNLGSVVDVSTGHAFKSSDYVDDGTFVLRVTNIEPTGLINQHDAKYFPVARVNGKYERYLLESGDLLLVMVGGSLGKIGIVDDSTLPALLNQNMWRFRALQGGPQSDFLYLLLKFVNRNQLNITSSTHGHLTQGTYLAQAIPLPPLPEQKRIVAKVEELTDLCNRLEKAHQTRNKLRDDFTASALDNLTQAQTPDQLKPAWTIIKNNFSTITATPDSIQKLRQTILQLAVQGRLVSQDPSEGTAGELLRQVSSSTEQLISEGVIPARKKLKPIRSSEPDEIPASWSWTNLEALLTEGPQNGWSPRTVDHATSVKTLKLSATTKGFFDENQFKYIDKDLPPDSKYWLRSGDLLIQRSNTPEYVGTAAIYRGDDGQFIYPDLMMRCRLSKLVSLEYVHLVLMSKPVRLWFAKQASGTSKSMIKVNQAVVRSVPIPLPPLPEQKRITSKVKELMDICEELEMALALKDKKATAFAQSVIAHQLAGEASETRALVEA